MKDEKDKKKPGAMPTSSWACDIGGHRHAHADVGMAPGSDSSFILHPSSLIVVDVGNSRIKWGRCLRGAVAESVSLPADDSSAWERQLEQWRGVGLQPAGDSAGRLETYPTAIRRAAEDKLPSLAHASGQCDTGPKRERGMVSLAARLTWAVAGVQPQVRDALVDWLRKRGEVVEVLASWRDVPLDIQVEQPDHVGMDRLLNAVAAKSRLAQGSSRTDCQSVPHSTRAIIIDAGTAVTVDLLDEQGVFRGGAIFPGLRLMAQALHDHTALLPLVDMGRIANPSYTNQSLPPLPGTSTDSAIAAGVFWAVAGGIRSLIDEFAAPPVDLFLTGGDASYLCPALDRTVLLWPTMTLEGVRISAEKKG